MPELPEVETIRRSLLHCVGKKIVGVQVREVRLRKRIDEERLHSIVGQTITGLQRQGKYLLIGLSDQRIVLLHFGMSGTLRLARGPCTWRTHEHVQFLLDPDWRWVLHDPRRFGLVWVGTPAEAPELHELGPDALSSQFSFDYLRSVTRRSRRPVKSLLLDQKLIAGIGNIYANEALFAAGLRPTRKACHLSGAALERLRASLRQVLLEAIAAGGSSIADFRDGNGRPGYFQFCFRVYGREGKPCLVCDTAIRRAVQGGRSSFYCPRCQR